MKLYGDYFIAARLISRCNRVYVLSIKLSSSDSHMREREGKRRRRAERKSRRNDVVERSVEIFTGHGCN